MTYLSRIISVTLKTKSCRNANFDVTGGTVGCHNDNLRCHQWRQSWHYDNSWFSVYVNSTLWFTHILRNANNCYYVLLMFDCMWLTCHIFFSDFGKNKIGNVIVHCIYPVECADFARSIQTSFQCNQYDCWCSCWCVVNMHDVMAWTRLSYCSALACLLGC